MLSKPVSDYPRRYGAFWKVRLPDSGPHDALHADSQPQNQWRVLGYFKTHLEAAGYKPNTIATYLSAARHLMRYFESRKVRLEKACAEDIADFLKTQLKRFRKRYGHSPKDRSWRNGYLGPIHEFLRIVHPSWPPETPTTDADERFRRVVLDGYGDWLTDRYGLSKGTLAKNGRIARKFSLWWTGRTKRRSFHHLCISDIDHYLSERLPGLRRATRYGECQGLRSFTRYLYAAHLNSKDLSPHIAGPVLYECEEIPRAFAETEIHAVLEAARLDRTAKGLRDYAILLVLATYGLRAGEVAGLQLDDIESRTDRLRVRQSKTGREYFLPLVPAGLRVGEIARLKLRDVDLVNESIEVINTKFFKSRRLPLSTSAAAALQNYLRARQHAGAPGHPDTGLWWHEKGSYSQVTVETLLRRVIRRAGLSPGDGSRGPRIHDIRHTFVVHRMTAWYQEGINPQRHLPYLATYLGHRNINSTLVYLTITQELLQLANQRFKDSESDVLKTIRGKQ